MPPRVQPAAYSLPPRSPKGEQISWFPLWQSDPWELLHEEFVYTIFPFRWFAFRFFVFFFLLFLFIHYLSFRYQCSPFYGFVSAKSVFHPPIVITLCLISCNDFIEPIRQIHLPGDVVPLYKQFGLR